MRVWGRGERGGKEGYCLLNIKPEKKLKKMKKKKKIACAKIAKGSACGFVAIAEANEFKPR